MLNPVFVFTLVFVYFDIMFNNFFLLHYLNNSILRYVVHLHKFKYYCLHFQLHLLSIYNNYYAIDY